MTEPTLEPNNRLSDLAREVDAASRTADLYEDDPEIHRLGKAVNLVAEICGITVLVAIVLLVFVNAVGRYAFQFTFIWADEMVLLLLPWLGMLGMFLSVRRRHIIRIDFFVASLPAPMRRVLDVAASVCAAAVFFYLATISMEYLRLFGADRTIYLRFKKGFFMAAMTIGPALTALAYLVLFFTDLRGKGKGKR
jgi:TRAP-type C4-dicarboxylate transport system permease small subunit